MALILLLAPSQCWHSCCFLFIFFSKVLKRAYKVNNKLNLLPEMTSFFFFCVVLFLNLETWIQTQVLKKKKKRLVFCTSLLSLKLIILQRQKIWVFIFIISFFSLSDLEINLYRLQLNSMFICNTLQARSFSFKFRGQRYRRKTFSS